VFEKDHVCAQPAGRTSDEATKEFKQENNHDEQKNRLSLGGTFDHYDHSGSMRLLAE
jgi:hypothetical protein